MTKSPDTGEVKTIEKAVAQYILDTALGLHPLDAGKILIAQLESIMQDYAMRYAEQVIGKNVVTDLYSPDGHDENRLRVQQRTTNQTMNGSLSLRNQTGDKS